MTSNVRGLYAQLREEAEQLAGAPEDMARRARAHLAIWHHSGGNHAFPLLAAHGALWGAHHIRRGRILSTILSLFSACPETRRAQAAAFSYALQEINRNVFIETYASYHLTRRVGDGAAEVLGDDITTLLCRCHVATEAGEMLSHSDHRALYEAFLQTEQDSVVAPDISGAVNDFDWPLLRALALRPPVRFTFFKALEVLRFTALDAKAQRVHNGLKAYDIAARRGWEIVSRSLNDYPEPRERPCRICACFSPA